MVIVKLAGERGYGDHEHKVEEQLQPAGMTLRPICARSAWSNLLLGQPVVISSAVRRAVRPPFQRRPRRSAIEFGGQGSEYRLRDAGCRGRVLTRHQPLVGDHVGFEVGRAGVLFSLDQRPAVGQREPTNAAGPWQTAAITPPSS